MPDPPIPKGVLPPCPPIRSVVAAVLPPYPPAVPVWVVNAPTPVAVPPAPPAT